MTNKKPLMHVFAAITIILWSLSFVVTRIAMRHFTADALSFLRYFVAAVTLIIYAFAKKMRLPAKRDVPLFFVGGAIGFACYVYLVNVGLQLMAASAVSFVVSASPIITAVLARLFLRERMGAVGWCSVACAFSGVAVITFFGGGVAVNSGAIWAAAAAVLVSAYNIFQRKLLLRYSPMEITTYCIIAGALLLSVFAPTAYPQLLSASPAEIAAVVALGVLPAAVAYACWAYALSLAEKTSDVTNYMFVTPILTTFLGFIMINEAPHISAYIGGALVLAGVALVNNRSLRPKHI